MDRAKGLLTTLRVIALLGNGSIEVVEALL
jgi:hypothetical protein